MSPFRFEDGEIHGIRTGRDGDRRALSHTVRHFLRHDAGFDLRPSNALSKGALAPEACRDIAAGSHPEGWTAMKRIPVGAAALKADASWSSPAMRPGVMEVHDRGYRPRYVTLCRRTRLPGRPGSGWKRTSPKHPERWTLSWDIYAVHAEWRPTDRTLRVVSAYRKAAMFDDETGHCAGYIGDRPRAMDDVDRALQAALRRSGR